jgi:hypothetical protein
MADHIRGVTAGAMQYNACFSGALFNVVSKRGVALAKHEM